MHYATMNCGQVVKKVPLQNMNTVLTQVIKAPLCTEAHLPLDIVLRVHPFLQTQEGVSWLGLQTLLNDYFVLTCVEETITTLSQNINHHSVSKHQTITTLCQNIKQTKHHSKVTGTHASYLSSHMFKSWSRDHITSTECFCDLTQSLRACQYPKSGHDHFM